MWNFWLLIVFALMMMCGITPFTCFYAIIILFFSSGPGAELSSEVPAHGTWRSSDVGSRPRTQGVLRPYRTKRTAHLHPTSHTNQRNGPLRSPDLLSGLSFRSGCRFCEALLLLELMLSNSLVEYQSARSWNSLWGYQRMRRKIRDLNERETFLTMILLLLFTITTRRQTEASQMHAGCTALHNVTWKI